MFSDTDKVNITHSYDTSLIDCMWCLTPFLPLFQLYHGGQFTYPCYPGVLFTSTIEIFFLSHWLHSHKPSSMDSRKEVMNPGPMTIINPREEYWLSRG